MSYCSILLCYKINFFVLYQDCFNNSNIHIITISYFKYNNVTISIALVVYKYLITDQVIVAHKRL